MLKIIETKNAPEAVGPYSQALLADGFLFCSGQLGVDPETNLLVEGGTLKQAEQAMKNVGAVLNEAGMDYCDIIKSIIYLKEMDEFGQVNALYASYFKEPYPVRSCIAVRELPKNALIEIEVIAFNHV